MPIKHIFHSTNFSHFITLKGFGWFCIATKLKYFEIKWVKIFIFINAESSFISNCYFTTGTKWCGSGNIAENYDDLGEYKDTDYCCREHDSCPDYIEAKGTKHGLTNTASFTRFDMKWVILFCSNKI